MSWSRSSLARRNRPSASPWAARRSERTHRLWGRIAAKEAARRLWLAAGDPPRYPADLAIVEDRGRPRLRDLARPERDDLPAISIAHTEGIVVALAARDPEALVGIDIEPVCECTEESDPLALTDDEVSWLPSGVKTSRCEWIARFRAARQAATKASGLSLAADRAVAKVVAADVDSGEVFVLLQGGRAIGAVGPRRCDHPGQHGEAGRSRLGMDPGRKG